MKYVLFRKFFNAGQIKILLLLTVILFISCKEKTYKSCYDEGIRDYKNLEYQKAILNFKKSIELNPGFETVYQRLAFTYREAKLLNDGVAYFQVLIHSSPGNTYLHYVLGLLFLYSNEFEKAVDKFETSIRINPAFIDAYYMLVESHKKTESVKQAVKYFSDKIKKNNDDPFAYYGLALAYRSLFQHKQALESVEQALRLKKELADAIFLKVKLLSDMGEYAQAVALADSGLKLTMSQKDADLEGAFLINKGMLYWYIGQNDSALQSLDKALKNAVERGHISHELQALNIKGMVFRVTSDFENALTAYRRALKIVYARGFYDHEGIILGNMGDIFLLKAGYDSALVYYQLSLKNLREIKDVRNEAATLSSIAAAYSYQTDYDKALKYGKMALGIYKRIGDRDGQAVELLNFGAIYIETGNYFNALNYLNQALEIIQKSGEKYHEQICLGNMGEAYYLLGDYDKAVDYLKAARKAAEEIDSKADVANRTAALGNVYLATGDTLRAIKNLNEALQVFIKDGDKRGQATTYGNLAVINTWQADYKKAEQYLEKALKIHREIGNRYGEGVTLYQAGDLQLETKNYDEAVKYYDSALLIGQKINLPEITGKALYGLGKTALQTGALPANQEKALKYFKNAVKSYEDIRSHLRLAELKAGFMESKMEIYTALTDLLYNNWLQSKENKYIEKAFYYAEKSKARALLDILAESRVNIKEHIDSLLWQRQRNTFNHLTDIQTQLISAKLTDGQRKQLNKRLKQKELELYNLQLEIKQKNPAYANLKYPEPVSIKEIQKLLTDEKDIMLEYALGEASSYLWMISKDTLFVYQLPSEKIIEKTVREYLSVLSSAPRAGSSPGRAGKALYNLLIKPVARQLDGATNLVIIADGILHYLPFEAIVFTDEKGAPRYLTEFVNISYAPSASVYRFLREKKKDDKKCALIAFADPVFGMKKGMAELTEASDKDIVRGMFERNGFKFKNLRYSRDEVKKIAGHFPKTDVSLYLREEASEENVKSGILNSCRMIHFATHALINEERPGRSCIVLTLDDDPTEDGLLRMNEIFNLKLNADLVTLSACRTGRGKLVRGEGILGLTRAFLYAGASSLVVSHWPVSDYFTAKFMDKFYGYLQEGNSKSAALRKVKLDFLNSKIPKERHPYYWAAFVLVGAGE